MKGFMDLLGVLAVAALGYYAWGQYQVMDEPAVSEQPVLSQMLTSEAPLLLGDLVAVRCNRSMALPWDSGRALACVVVAGRGGAAVPVEVRLDVPDGEYLFPFEVSRNEVDGELRVSAAVIRDELSPAAAVALVHKRIRRVRLKVEDPEAGRLLEAEAAAKRRAETRKSWAPSAAPSKP